MLFNVIVAPLKPYGTLFGHLKCTRIIYIREPLINSLMELYDSLCALHLFNKLHIYRKTARPNIFKRISI